MLDIDATRYSFTEINFATFLIRPSVCNLGEFAMPGAGVSHPDPRTTRQARMSGGETFRVESLAARGLPPLPVVAIPRGHAVPTLAHLKAFRCDGSRGFSGGR